MSPGKIIQYQVIIEPTADALLNFPRKLSARFNRGWNLNSAKTELIAVVDDDKSLVEATVSLMESVGRLATLTFSPLSFRY